MHCDSEFGQLAPERRYGAGQTMAAVGLVVTVDLTELAKAKPYARIAPPEKRWEGGHDIKGDGRLDRSREPYVDWNSACPWRSLHDRRQRREDCLG
jgi:hypothetical protein